MYTVRTKAKQRTVNILLSERIAFVRNQEGGVCQVRILRETEDRYVVGYPDPGINGTKLQALMKTEWRIVPAKSALYYVYAAIGVVLGLLVSGAYIYLNAR